MIILVGGGPIDPEWFQSLPEDGQWVGVDRGTVFLLEYGLRVDHAFGDFDSVTAVEKKMILQKVSTVHEEPPEKDATDMELALQWALSQNEEIKMIGVTGGRLDHFFGNIQLLLSDHALNHAYPVSIEDEKNKVTCHLPGNTTVEKDVHYPYLSFIPFTHQVKGLTLSGVKYPLSNHEISYGMTLTLSNEILDNFASISFSEGILMMIRSRD
ncbi:thiamine diphosphokinase [Jeotgalibacillus terrae]|uniref:Thiamine diphosphokinase n=1 Tax=Jeotgalibacillus terrae TaxID=587735 RepID=A0ABW5ZDU8_9BACL|nr:thiamine diphosphokinase [Jeotgalibacillus terrae]MBM7578454.1 thiamine pyrophosphokinase [Jeotgalibacillus terrae]